MQSQACLNYAEMHPVLWKNSKKTLLEGKMESLFIIAGKESLQLKYHSYKLIIFSCLIKGFFQFSF